MTAGISQPAAAALGVPACAGPDARRSMPMNGFSSSGRSARAATISVSEPSRLAALISLTKPTCDTRAFGFATNTRMMSELPRLISASVTVSPMLSRLAMIIRWLGLAGAGVGHDGRELFGGQRGAFLEQHARDLEVGVRGQLADQRRRRPGARHQPLAELDQRVPIGVLGDGDENLVEHRHLVFRVE